METVELEMVAWFGREMVAWFGREMVAWFGREMVVGCTVLETLVQSEQDI